MRALGLVRTLGLLFCLVLIAVAMDTAAGLDAFADISSAVFVVGGGLAYALARRGIEHNLPLALTNFGTGAVCFGWLGFLIGIVAILQNVDDVSKMGPAIAIALSTILYGYILKWMIQAALD